MTAILCLEIISDKPHNSSYATAIWNASSATSESHTLLTLFLKEKDVRLTDKRVLRKALFIPDTLSLYDVLKTFKTSGEDFAVVVNEYALVVGVVTLKDVMSIVMGGWSIPKKSRNHPPRRTPGWWTARPCCRRCQCARWISKSFPIQKTMKPSPAYDVFPAENPETHGFSGLCRL